MILDYLIWLHSCFIASCLHDYPENLSFIKLPYLLMIHSKKRLITEQEIYRLGFLKYLKTNNTKQSMLPLYLNFTILGLLSTVATLACDIDSFSKIVFNSDASSKGKCLILQIDTISKKSLHVIFLPCSQKL